MIFIVEDDEAIRDLVVYTLQNTGFSAKGFGSGKEFFSEMSNELPQLVLLDIMLPGEDGIKILKRLRSEPLTKKIPVMMLTAKSNEYDKVIGLDSGADDYITKPFGMMELISRIKAVLRRYSPNDEEFPEYIFDSVSVNTKAHSVTVCKKNVELTLKEYELLCLLLKNQGAVMTRDMLLGTVWGYDFDGETRTVDVHIRTLRNKLGEQGDIIRTVRGVGYKIGE